jgi:hypothetical protein
MGNVFLHSIEIDVVDLGIPEVRNEMVSDVPPVLFVGTVPYVRLLVFEPALSNF